MKNVYKFLSVAFIASSFTSLQATNYYASPTGSGNGTSYNTPTTLKNGISKLSSAGDTLFVLGGQYDLNDKLTVAKSGNITKNIVITNYPGERPILDFRKQSYGSENSSYNNVGLSISESAKYLHVRGLTIRYAGKNGLINYGSYNTIENIDVYGCGDTGIQHKTGGGNTIINCDSHDNFDYKLLKDDGSADFGGNADGFADKQYSNQLKNVYIGCRSWNNSDDGWDFYQRVGNTEFYDCICYNNGPDYYDMREHPRYETDKAWFDQFPKEMIDRYGNTIYVTLEKYINLGNGNGFKLGGNSTVHNVVLNNCLSAENIVNGFDQNNNFGTMTINNCTAYNDGTNYGFSNNKGGNLIIRNSVSFNGKSADRFNCLSVSSSYNSWNTSGVTCTKNDFLSLDASLITTPRKDDGSLAYTPFMQLSEGSNLIDKGIDLGLQFSGAAPDLGCYEFGELNPLPGIVSCISENLTQNVITGNQIIPVILKWSGSATGLVAELPSGLSGIIDEDTKTLTISGTPVSGKHIINIKTIGDAENTSIECLIKVNNAFKTIAYVTTPDNLADEAILKQLNYNLDFAVEIKDASLNHDYSTFDMILLSPVPNSSLAGLAAVKTVEKPKVILKPFQFNASRWNWGTAVNTSDKSIYIKESSHPIFKDIEIEDFDNTELFSVVSTNGVTAISSWTSSSDIISIASPVSFSNYDAVVEIPAGANMNGTITSHNSIMFGVSEFSTANITETATKIIENSCYYVMDMSGTTSIDNIFDNTSESVIIKKRSNSIVVESETKITEISIFNLSGKMIKSVSGNEIETGAINKGVYILKIKNDNNVMSHIKFVI